MQVPISRLTARGGVPFLEQELTRCSTQGYRLVPGESIYEIIGPWWRRRGVLRFLFEKIEPDQASAGDEQRSGQPARDAPDGYEFVAVYVNVSKAPVGLPALYARDASDQLTGFAKHGYLLQEIVEWPGHWVIILQRPFGQPTAAARYELQAVARSEVRNDRPAPWPDDRKTVGLLTTPSHLFPIQLVPGRSTTRRSRSGE